jgi:hypothetical protein
MKSSLTFFHLAPILLAPGSQILPGNWGRIKRQQPNLEGVLFREYVIEQVRQREFPSKPSRLDCVFAFRDADTARGFAAQAGGWFATCILYRVSTEADSASIHYANYNFPGPGGGAMDSVEELARTYWAEEPKECVEVLIQAPVTITEVVT